MVRDEGLPADVFVWRTGMEQWQPLNTIAVTLATIAQKEALHYLGQPTPRGMSFDEAALALDSASQVPEKKEALDRWTKLSSKRDQFVDYCAVAEKRIPLSPFELEMHLEDLQRQMGPDFNAVEPHELYRILERYRRPRGWEEDPASDAQKRLLLSKNIPVPVGMTKGEAYAVISQILDGATEGQIRRLHFYGIDPDGVTKKEAAILIDDFIGKHPDAETDYQRWKMSSGEQTMSGLATLSNPPRSVRQGKNSTLVVVVIVAAATVVALLLFALSHT